MAETKCKGEHSGHICVLASNQKFAEIKAITKNPQYICFNCGRVADCDANLCNPMPLK
jgi:hypothetical protein